MSMTHYCAHYLYRLGFSLIPISRKSKKPVVKWKRFQTTRCTPADLWEWFVEHDYRIGIVTGQLSGIVAVDCDGIDAVDAFLDYTVDHDNMPESDCSQWTPHGCHYIYRHPGADTRCGRGFLGETIDIRGDGGYIMAYEDSRSWDREEMMGLYVFEPLPREALQVA